MGRVCITHSTYIPGLIPVLRKLCQQDGIDTCTPAVIRRVRGSAATFQLRITTPLLNGGGFKAIARKAGSSQEVFITTPLSKVQLQALVQRVLRG